MKIQAERKVAVLEKENGELKEELGRVKLKCTELEVSLANMLVLDCRHCIKSYIEIG